jgi:hypothetical protein
MAKATDPFERAVDREKRLRERAATFESPAAVLGLAIWWFAALGLGWTAILTAHWLLFAEPRWLVILHTVVFALMVGYWCITMTFITKVKKRRPDWFAD